MVESAKRAGLAFDDAQLLTRTHPNALGALHESRTGPYKLIPAHHRPIGKSVQRPETPDDPIGPSNEALHGSTRKRFEDDESYRPPDLVNYIEAQG